ncbi:dUTP diphosphatase [Paenibacillus naphthalenovorans]|uniref:dUTP diphosphatase n=1 Tax=Paenibacillus naphthalenovorans TaxID=162209 RepID=UPI003D2823DB
MNVKIRKLHPDAVIPEYATSGSAGFDLVACEDVVIAPGETKKVPLGLSFEIPEGYVMYVCMRSGIALKTKLRQPNGIGVIDPDYRGEVAMMFDNINNVPDWENYARGIDNIGVIETLNKYPSGTYIVRKGDRIAQGVIAPVKRASFTAVDTLSDTERGTGGFGHSGIRSEVGE